MSIAELVSRGWPSTSRSCAAVVKVSLNSAMVMAVVPGPRSPDPACSLPVARTLCRCGPGATTALAPAPLIWCTGTELAAQSRGDGRLIARTYEIFPLPCPICGGQMCLIAFITEGTQILKILDHIGVVPDPLNKSNSI